MAEKFRINGTFRNRSAVDGNVRPVLPAAKLVDDLRKTFLTNTALSRHQYGKVGRSHLHGYIYRAVQSLGIADDAEPQLHALYFCLHHKFPRII